MYFWPQRIQGDSQNTKPVAFTLKHTDPGSKARAGVLQTAHGEIRTPIFMPVGTAGTVKGVHHPVRVHAVTLP